MATRPAIKEATEDVAEEIVEKAFPEKGRVFTNTRFPEVKLLGPHGSWLKFNSTKIIARDPATADFLDGRNGIYAEPDEFLDLDPNDEKFFVHKRTGFKTLNRDAYNDWINRSEWSATAIR